MKQRLMLPALFLILAACSSQVEVTKEETAKEKEEIYVFDDVDQPDTTIIDTGDAKVEADTSKPAAPVNEIIEAATAYLYTIQLGAFTSLERAETFIKENGFKLSEKMEIVFNNGNRLFLVKVGLFNSRTDAEKAQDAIHQAGFHDAFVTPKRK
jgi:cell division septation protein DedD